EAPVHLRHDRPDLLVTYEDGPDARRVVERVEDPSGVAARHAEHEVDAGLFEDADDGVRNVDLVCNHSAKLRSPLHQVKDAVGAATRSESGATLLGGTRGESPCTGPYGFPMTSSRWCSSSRRPTGAGSSRPRSPGCVMASRSRRS